LVNGILPFTLKPIGVKRLLPLSLDQNRKVFRHLPARSCASAGQPSTIANALVDEGLAACVQIDGPIESLYIWEGKRCQSTEYRLWIKVLETHLSAARERVKSLHSYETPQWIEVEAIKVDEKYLNWAKEASNLRGFQKPEPI
jgi:periplasmic divalent cation tolerance protein